MPIRLEKMPRWPAGTDFRSPQQGQATLSAAQMSDEYNLARSHAEGVAEPLAALQRNQQSLLYRNLENVGDSLDRLSPKSSAQMRRWRLIKTPRAASSGEKKKKPAPFNGMAEEQGELISCFL